LPAPKRHNHPVLVLQQLGVSDHGFAVNLDRYRFMLFA
jgi:hypothetical protein